MAMPIPDGEQKPAARKKPTKKKTPPPAPVVSPPAKDHAPIKPTPKPAYTGSNKMKKFLAGMEHQNRLIMASMGIDAPVIDMTALMDSDDDDEPLGVAQTVDDDSDDDDDTPLSTLIASRKEKYKPKGNKFGTKSSTL